jgi:hypothetical protein
VLQVFEHIPRPYQAHAELLRILRPGGTHVFTAPFAPVTGGGGCKQVTAVATASQRAHVLCITNSKALPQLF